MCNKYFVAAAMEALIELFPDNCSYDVASDFGNMYIMGWVK